MKKYMDTTLSAKERAEALLKELSLEEKVRQISCSSVLMIMPLEMQDLKGGTGAATIGLGRSERFLDDVKEVQDYVMEHSPHHIPALFHTEGLAGPLCLFGGNQYPISIGLGATFEPELVEEMAAYTRRQLAANGVRHALSPVCDLARDLRWGRCNETYGGDPTLASAMTVAFVKGMQGDDAKTGVAATCKHFLGYSASEGALNSFQTLLSENQIREQYAKPFEAAIHMAGLKTVMNSYSAVNGRPVTANRAILTDLLRDDLGFDGLVVADYGSINQIKSPYNLAETNTDAARLALDAGLDVEFPERAVYTQELVEAVRKGELSEALIDRSALRMLTLKFELGLFENPYGVGDLALAMDNSAPNAGSRLVARKSMTLLKNDGILPIEDAKKKIAVIGPVANSLRLLYSHYTATSMREMVAALMKEKAEAKNADIVNIMNQGREEELAGTPQPRSIGDKYFFDGEIRKAYPEAQTIFEAIRERFESVEFCEGCDYKGEDRSGFAAAVELARRSDIVVLAVGEKSGIDASCTSGEGVDATSLSLPGVQDELVKAVYAANPKAVIVHTGCRPLCWEWAYGNIPAILEAWFPATYGADAIAAVLTGEYCPAGRTPVDLPRNAAHTPVYHCQYNGSSSDDRQGMDGTGYADSPSTSLRPFGYGLSYTKFDYSDLTLQADEAGNLVISVTVKNIGERAGEEIVQLYGKDMIASMVRPRQELLGFKRVALQAGESRRVAFAFNIDILSFVNYEKQWVAEAGKFEFFVGSHSKDKRLTCSYTLRETKKIDPNHRTFFARAACI